MQAPRRRSRRSCTARARRDVRRGRASRAGPPRRRARGPQPQPPGADLAARVGLVGQRAGVAACCGSRSSRCSAIARSSSSPSAASRLSSSCATGSAARARWPGADRRPRAREAVPRPGEGEEVGAPAAAVGRQHRAHAAVLVHVGADDDPLVVPHALEHRLARCDRHAVDRHPQALDRACCCRGGGFA